MTIEIGTGIICNKIMLTQEISNIKRKEIVFDKDY